MCMWNNFLYKVFVFLNVLRVFKCERNTSNGCHDEPNCLKCGAVGCMKCLKLIIQSTRKCVNSCPFGYRKKWSLESDYMGQICVRTKSVLGLSADSVSVLIGMLCGTIVCILIIISAVVYLKNKRKQLPQVFETNSDVDDSPDRRDFLKQLDILRSHAPIFLEMLNDTRRQIRELHQKGDNTAASAYKPVIKDLAKILLLLNRPVDILTVPDNWEHLHKWAEKVLRRMSATSQTQVNQLVEFLQAPIIRNEPDEILRANTAMSTFKPDVIFHSSHLQSSKRNSCESSFDSSINPQWQFNYPLVCNKQISSSEFTPALWKNSKEYLNSPYFLDDDFYQFGFRPQDEITTEL